MKAVLILDHMPESCSDCEFQYFGFGVIHEYCTIAQNQCEVTGNYIRPEWCPLKSFCYCKECRNQPECLTYAHWWLLKVPEERQFCGAGVKKDAVE